MKKSVLVGVLFSILSFEIMATPASFKEKLIVTNCMYNQINSQVKLVAQSDKFSLIEAIRNDGLTQLLHANRVSCGKYLNLAPYVKNKSYSKLPPQQLLSTLTKNKALPKANLFKINNGKQVRALLKNIDPNRLWGTMQDLTSYINRSAETDTGIAAAYWFKQQFASTAKHYKREDVESYFVQTGTEYEQPSVVTVIGKNKPGAAIVIGAHIDTLEGNMPGADDDASGIAVITEVSRVLLSSDINFEHPIYIIAYAAEEQGLVGSNYVVQSFLDKKIPVKAVMQLDQAGFRANPQAKTIWLIEDFVDPELTHFVASLLTHYVKVPVAYTECGYACSDHANWSLEGFRASYPSGTTLDDDNENIHTSDDILETIQLEHLVNFTKLGLAFAVELGVN